MKQDFLQWEILIFTSTTFSQRELRSGARQDDSKPGKSAREQLKEECWNGRLADILPEIFAGQEIKENIFLWNIYDGDSFIALEMAEQQIFPEATYSLSPALFLPVTNCN